MASELRGLLVHEFAVAFKLKYRDFAQFSTAQQVFRQDGIVYSAA